MGADEAVGVLWVATVGAGAWSAGDTAGSADSSVPVMERKPASLAALIVMLLCRLAAGALVACWVQCARVCWPGAVNGALIPARPAGTSKEVRRSGPARGAQSLADAAEARGRCRCRKAGASGRWVHWQRVVL
jgi:hypothetical protein